MCVALVITQAEAVVLTPEVLIAKAPSGAVDVAGAEASIRTLAVVQRGWAVDVTEAYAARQGSRRTNPGWRFEHMGWSPPPGGAGHLFPRSRPQARGRWAGCSSAVAVGLAGGIAGAVTVVLACRVAGAVAVVLAGDVLRPVAMGVAAGVAGPNAVVRAQAVPNGHGTVLGAEPADRRASLQAAASPALRHGASVPSCSRRVPVPESGVVVGVMVSGPHVVRSRLGPAQGEPAQRDEHREHHRDVEPAPPVKSESSAHFGLGVSKAHATPPRAARDRSVRQISYLGQISGQLRHSGLQGR